ncbi:MAG TPA: flagellar basal body P-ring protein FlgI [Acidobacteriota bacterium]|nr:flagellar basal body P-ring protein FlgI [Acidobacteriota bacterium]
MSRTFPFVPGAAPRVIAALLTVAVVATLTIPGTAAAGVRLKDLSHMAGPGSTALFGYGLVVGLDGTGDGQGTEFTVQTLSSMLRRMGITVDPDQVKVKNVAAVMVTARLTPQMVRSERLDVTVSSMGDAKSLRGGTLLMTPLAARDGTVHAFAQGPVSTGGFAVEADGGGASVSRNYNLVGRVPGGGAVETPMFQLPADPEYVELVLHNPDWTTAHRMAEVIRAQWGEVADARQPSLVSVAIPDEYKDVSGRARFIAELESLEVEPDQAARVVINEKTGTIVAGEHVSIAPVAIAHGGITVEIQSIPVISQPAPFSDGETVVAQESGITVQDETAHVVYIPGTGTIKDVAESLNAIGATPRDMIAIFQALKEAGALRAELIIL